MESESLFAYGVLMDREIQREILRRIPPHQKFDILGGYRRSRILIQGALYPIAIPDAKSSIEGLILSVTPEELIGLDQFETDAYRRVKVTLQSGTKAWAYVK